MKYNPEKIGELVSSTRKGMGVTQKNLAMTSGTGLRFIVSGKGGALYSGWGWLVSCGDET